MRRLLSLAFLLAFASSAHAGDAFTGRVVSIADGDTLTMLDQDRHQHIIRLAEVDAPEKGQAWGARSKPHLAELCFQRRAEVRPQTTDRYGRTVARVICDGTDSSAEMVRSGMAWAFTKYLTDPQIKAIEVEARADQRGLWADRESVAPWEWRKTRSGS